MITEIVAGVGQMSCHHIVKCVSVHLVVFAATAEYYCRILLQDTAGYCRILQDTAGYCRILQVLQDTAGYCGVLDTAVYCRILLHTT